MRTHLQRFGILAAVVAVMGQSCISFGKAPTGPMGVFRSADKGDSWEQKNSYPTPQGVKSLAGARVYRLFTDPSDPNAIYMATRGQGLYYSYDRGDSWRFADAMVNKYIYGVVVDPSDKCTLYVTDGANIFKSDDCSRTWKTVYTETRGQKITALAISPSSPAVVYASLFSGEIVQSADAGASWRVIKKFNAAIQVVATDPQSPGRLYVASVDNGFARSDDGGATWTSLTEGLRAFNDALVFYRLFLNPGQKDSVFWLSKYGLLRSDDAGKTWKEIKLLSPPGGVNIYSFAVSPKNQKEMYYVGTVFDDKGASRSTFYKSTDGGVNWVTKKLPTNTIPVTILVHPIDTNVLIMGFTIPDKK